MRNLIYISALLFFSAACFAQPRKVSNLPVPPGYTRIACGSGSYGAWVRALPLKENASILTYDGTLISPDYYEVLAVVALPLLFKQDLEQCADFGCRFWAEYHRQAGRLSKLYLFDYNGNRKYFQTSGKTFNGFLRQCMAFSNSFSLKKGCVAVDSSELRPGDMFVQNRTGGIGHVSVIVDACADAAGRKLYLVGFSFMPAQEFHIEKATGSYGTGGWFSLQGYVRYLQDHLDYGPPVLKRFEE